MATAVKTRAATALTSMVAFLTGMSAGRSDAELLLSKSPDQREDIGLTIADIHAIRG